MFSCNEENEAVSLLEACYSFLPVDVLVGNTVNFNDESIGTNENTEYIWNFGDDNTSITKNPTYTYTQIGDGTYDVSLTIKNGNRQAVAEQTLTVSLSNIIDGRSSLIEKLADGEILVCAHRAYHKTSPENSMSAITESIAQGVEMVEIDIRQTRDGKLVLMHDATVDRTTNGIGKVADYSLQELREFKLYMSNGVLTNEKIPTLKEILNVSRGKLYIDLDISKKAKFEAVYNVVKQYGMLNQVLFYSSKLTAISNMVGTDSDVVPMPIIDDDSDFNVYADLDLDIVHYTSSSFNQSLIQKAKEKGWYIFRNAYVNSTITPLTDNYNQIDKVVLLEGNIIQTDHPVLINNYLH